MMISSLKVICTLSGSRQDCLKILYKILDLNEFNIIQTQLVLQSNLYTL